MSLSCTCNDYDGDGWFYTYSKDFSVLQTKRSRKCCSCQTKIKPGDDCMKFDRARNPQSDVEDSIYGDEVPLASWYMCESCGGVFLSAIELGMCFDLDGNIKHQVRELAFDKGHL